MKIELADGRTFAYAEYGDPKGIPCFFIHGAPGSRLFHPPDEITKRLGVRLICMDRPGYGESTFQPNRRILDCATDIEQLADFLGFEKFAILGQSGGGPHTLACAHALHARITTAGVVSGAGPVDTPAATEGMTPLNWFGFKFGKFIPWPMGYAIVWWFFRGWADDPVKWMQKDFGHRPPADDEVLRDPETQEMCIRSDTEAFRQGLRAYAWDIRLITRPWGFQLEEIKIPVHIWHGTDDDTTSVRMADYMAKKIPDSQLTICEGEGHMLFVPRWEEILSALLK